MKNQWEAGDVYAGRIVTSPTTATNNRYILGYTVNPPQRHIVSLADGMIAVTFAKADADDDIDQRLADYLTRIGYAPIEGDRELREAAAVVSGVKR